MGVRETADREQVKRDAEALIAANPGEEVEDFGYDELRFAHACLALLAELEQAERRAKAGDAAHERMHAAEARLAKVPALVEALRNWLDDVDEARPVRHLPDLEQRIGAMFLGFGGSHNHEDDIREALAAWESE